MQEQISLLLIYAVSFGKNRSSSLEEQDIHSFASQRQTSPWRCGPFARLTVLTDDTVMGCFFKLLKKKRDPSADISVRRVSRSEPRVRKHRQQRRHLHHRAPERFHHTLAPGGGVLCEGGLLRSGPAGEWRIARRRRRSSSSDQMSEGLKY